METENKDRFHSIMQKPVYWCRSSIEWHASKIYTSGIYLKFVTELVNSTAFGVHEVIKDKVYELKRMFYYERPEYRRDVFTVLLTEVVQQLSVNVASMKKMVFCVSTF
jgi:hypothetical protein